jgi:oligopeptide/dipeptide ABC transporter ATP-binding protein
MPEEILDVENLQSYYFTRAGTVKAVDKVSFRMDRGETLGLVGESGCGKSTLGFSILRLIPPPGRIVGGKIIFEGSDLTAKSDSEMREIRGKRISMIFQDPMTSLNPLMKIGDHLTETITTHVKITKEEAVEKAKVLLSNLGILPERINDYPHQFSGGMRQRVVIGLALVLDPDIVIADEPTTSLDVIVEAQILELLKKMKKAYNLTLILITHNIGIVAEMADYIAVMYAGKIVELSDALSLFDKPLHPYTKALLESIPNIKLSEQVLESIPGMPPDLLSPPKGCRFNPRCPYSSKKCFEMEPELVQVGKDRFVACHLQR